MYLKKMRFLWVEGTCKGEGRGGGGDVTHIGVANNVSSMEALFFFTSFPYTNPQIYMRYFACSLGLPCGDNTWAGIAQSV